MILSKLHYLVVAAAIALPLSLSAAPATITHQGRLLDASGLPLADNSYGAVFSLWDDPVAGTQVWSEPQDIQTVNGLFSAELGQIDSFFDIFTDVELYLEVQVQVGGSIETLSPRLRLGSVPFAFSSQRVHGIHSGVSESSHVMVAATDSGAVMYLDEDSDNDGLSDVSSSMYASPAAAGQTFEWNSSTSSARRRGDVVVEDIQCSIVLDTDDDGDGISETSSSMYASPAAAGQTFEWNSTTSSARRRGDVVVEDIQCSIVLDTDDDGDGISETSSSMYASPAAAGQTFEWNSTTSSARRRGDVVVEDIQCSIVLDTDDDGDGISDASASIFTSPTGTGHAYVWDSQTDLARRRADVKCEDIKCSMVLDSDDDGDGLSECSVSAIAASDGVGGVGDGGGSLEISEGDIGCTLSSRGWDGTYKGRLSLSVGGVSQVEFTSDGDGFVASRFGIGIEEPDYPLDHSSGAHLTAGGVFTNASDINLKENFQAVDGEEILDKIALLEVSQWNYKNESDEVTHIGPTAQDFKATFGVGDNDKSISTIDPAGIALVAVKALRKENLDLRAEVEELRQMVEDLARKQ